MTNPFKGKLTLSRPPANAPVGPAGTSSGMTRPAAVTNIYLGDTPAFETHPSRGASWTTGSFADVLPGAEGTPVENVENEPSESDTTDTAVTGTRVSGPIAFEGELTGDDRKMERGAIVWDVLPIPIIWDREEGDHTAMVVGAVTAIERQGDVIVATEAHLDSDSEDVQVQAAVTRILELLADGAVGVSVGLDNVSEEIRIRKELLQSADEGLADPDDVAAEGPVDEDGLVTVMTAKAGDVVNVVTAGRVRHLAIVDTSAFADAHLGIAAAAGGSIDLTGRWEGLAWMFENPKFGLPGQDDRLRYDPERDRWSCPSTVQRTERGIRVFGHINPSGICLVGKPGRCTVPPDAILDSFMRAGPVPSAGGKRTGVLTFGNHHQTGIGAEASMAYYDSVGRGIVDVRVGKDAYGTWFSGMVRPGTSEEDVYALTGSDVSGHWEPDRKGRMMLCGLIGVNLGGFPKGYMTAAELSAGVAASAAPETDCGCDDPGGELLEATFESFDFAAKLDTLVRTVTELYADYLTRTAPQD